MSRLLASASKVAADTAAKLPGIASASSASAAAGSRSAAAEPPAAAALEPAVAQVVALAAVAVVQLEQDRDRQQQLAGDETCSALESRMASHEQWLEGLCRAVRLLSAAAKDARLAY